MRVGLRQAVLIAAAVAVLPLAVAPAGAVEPGVFIDPSTPANKEYSIPLTVDRAAGAGRSTSNPNATPPRFGVGVTPASAAQAAHGSERSGRTSSRRGSRLAPGSSAASRADRAAATSSSARSATGAAREVRLAQLAKPGSSFWPVAFIVVLALVVGLAGAAAIARLRR